VGLKPEFNKTLNRAVILLFAKKIGFVGAKIGARRHLLFVQSPRFSVQPKSEARRFGKVRSAFGL
jgi:hypothetical protein